MEGTKGLGLAICFAAISFAFVAWVSFGPPARGETTVIFAPNISENEIWTHVSEAGGYVVSPTGFSNIVVAFADDEGFRARIAARGGLTFAASPGLCLSLASQEELLS